MSDTQELARHRTTLFSLAKLAGHEGRMLSLDAAYLLISDALESGKESQRLAEELGAELAELREWKATAEAAKHGEADPMAEELAEAKAAARELAAYVEDVDRLRNLEDAVEKRSERILRLAQDWTGF